jgi:hypothetical protein
MKPQAEIGRIEHESGHARGGGRKGYRGHKSGSRARGLVLSLLVTFGAAELTTGAVAKATPQSENSLETTSQLSAKPPAQDWHPQITVHVYNYAQVDARDLLGGEQIAADILRKAGVDIVWLTCSTGERFHGEAECPRPSSSLDLILQLVTSAKAKQFRLMDNAYGFAVGSTNKEFTCFAWVFYDLLNGSALKLQMSTAHILGNIIAHELGHLLLGANAHSNWGIMRGRWSVKQLLAADCRELGFSNAERAKIQNSVAARHQAQILDQAQQAPDATNAATNNEIPSGLRDTLLSK